MTKTFGPKKWTIYKSSFSAINFLQFAAKSSVTDPKDIRIVETDPSGEAHEATHLTLGENETHFYNNEAEFEEDDDRGGWGNQLDFLFSCISVSVGLGSKLFAVYSIRAIR